MTNAAPDHVDVLSPDQVHAWHRDGYLLLAEALTPEMLVGLRTVVEAWVEESRGYTEPYGVTIDGRPRFDIEPGHCADAPALRRVASPVEVAPEFLDAMNNSIAADAVAQLIGPSIKHHNSKLNSKLPGAATAVKYHQDFLFQPYSNEDLIAVLFFVDEVTLENGPLEVVPRLASRAALRSLARRCFHRLGSPRCCRGGPNSGRGLHRTGWYGLFDAHPSRAWFGG